MLNKFLVGILMVVYYQIGIVLSNIPEKFDDPTYVVGFIGSILCVMAIMSFVKE